MKTKNKGSTVAQWLKIPTTSQASGVQIPSNPNGFFYVFFCASRGGSEPTLNCRSTVSLEK